MSDIQFIDATELVAVMNEGYVQVIDVRDEDYAHGGHLPGALNAPSENWTDEDYVTELTNRYTSTDCEKRLFVFHCMKSQQRGPTCARIFASKLKAIPNASELQM